MPNFIGETDALERAGGERLSQLQMSSNAAAVLLDFGLCCCWCGASGQWDAGIGQFIFYNPMDTVMALQRNVVVGNCWGQTNREKKEMGLDGAGRGASWETAQFSACELVDWFPCCSFCALILSSPCACFHSLSTTKSFFSPPFNPPPSNYSPWNPNVSVIFRELSTNQAEPFGGLMR